LLSNNIFKVGQIVEGYKIDNLIGRGGMSELFLAHDIVLGKKVVIKVLKEPYSENEYFKKQFLTEARIQANLDNPHIVQIFRIFTYQKKISLVLQYIDGTNLARVIKRAKELREKEGKKGALSLERGVHIFLQMLDGIGYAHRYRIIHKDIKPSNILLDKQGLVRVVDFGLSFHLPKGNIKKEKKDEVIAGTPYYMSPEQILNKKVDFRSDIYSLGITFFYMLTGCFPSGPNKDPDSILRFHLEGSLDYPQRILEEHKEIIPRIREAILKAIEKDPDNRHQSCLEFSLAIKGEKLDEMYSELLRRALSKKGIITLTERSYLDKIAPKKGLSLKDAMVLETNIRKEMGLPPLDFALEYKMAFLDLLKKKRHENSIFLDELDNTYVRKGRLTKTEARLIREKVQLARTEK